MCLFRRKCSIPGPENPCSPSQHSKYMICIPYHFPCTANSNRVGQNVICCLLSLVFSLWLTDLIFQSLKFNVLSPVWLELQFAVKYVCMLACHLHMFKSSTWVHRRPVSISNLVLIRKYIFKAVNLVNLVLFLTCSTLQ